MLMTGSCVVEDVSGRWSCDCEYEYTEGWDGNIGESWFGVL